MGDEIVVMNKGKIQQAASPMMLYHEPANLFTAQFIGTPAMNKLPIPDLDVLDLLLDGEAAYLGFRPEHAAFHNDSYAPAYVLEGEVLTCESLGAETIYQIRGQAGIFFVKTFLQPQESGLHVKIRVPFERLYFFRADGSRIQREPQIDKGLVTATAGGNEE